MVKKCEIWIFVSLQLLIAQIIGTMLKTTAWSNYPSMGFNSQMISE